MWKTARLRFWKTTFPCSAQVAKLGSWINSSDPEMEFLASNSFIASGQHPSLPGCVSQFQQVFPERSRDGNRMESHGIAVFLPFGFPIFPKLLDVPLAINIHQSRAEERLCSIFSSWKAAPLSRGARGQGRVSTTHCHFGCCWCWGDAGCYVIPEGLLR